PEDTKQEWIELFNRGTESVNLTGWGFNDGVDFVFPNVTLAAGKYLVVAADVAVFTAKHPGVTNVVGGWTGWLRDSGETLALVDSAGVVVNTVRYAHQGDWGVRELGPVSSGHRGWQWSTVSDGGGKSLELINASLPNDLGQNWAVSVVDGGTPGKANSVAAGNIAPMILDVAHQPIIPRSVDPVTVAARILDEQTTGLVVTLRYRLDSSTYANTNSYPQFNAASYLSVPMVDDGAHGDGQASDGVFGGAIGAQQNGKIVEFYIEAKDSTGKARTWPAPSLVDGVAQQVTNALYQVDNSYNPVWTPGSQPVYYVIMTEMERARLAYIGNHSNLSGPDAQMNATFISVDGTGLQLRYNTGARNRGHGTRNGPPNNQHVAFAEDRLWNGRGAISFNCRNTHDQVLGSAIFRMAGLVAAYNTPVQLRVNGTNLATTGSPMYGVYGRLDAVDSFMVKQQFPSDPDGNFYTCFRDNGEADLRYLGTNPNSYRPSYFKGTNASQDDWSDLIHLVDVLNNAPEATYFQDVGKVLNVSQWLRYVALDSLLMNNETGLNGGIGDDYFMYRGVIDPRFVLFPHDLDTILDTGGSVSASIFSIVRGGGSYNGVDGLKRFFSHPEVIPRYYQAMLDLMNEFFNPETLDPLIDRVLGGFAPADRISAMKQRVRQRITAVLAQIPQGLTVSGTRISGTTYLPSVNSTVDLSGKAHAGKTRSVLVNGRPAVWSPIDASWSLARVPVNPGVTRVVIQALDAAGQEIDRCSADVWCDARPLVTKAGGTLNADEVWTAANGPYRVTGSITIPAGRTLTVEPGTTVFPDASCGFIVHGRLVVRGAEYQRIRFTRLPGMATQWAGFQFPDTREDNVIAYADLGFGGSRSEWITTGNRNANVVGPTARLTIDHVTFSGSDTQYFSIWDPQIIIRNSVFADLGTHYQCMVERMPADGWFLVEGNLFGHTHGDTDILHLNSVSVKGGPVAQIIDNVFTGGGDDLVDDNETDTYIEGNLFMHANVGNTGRSASAAVTTGPGGGSASANNLDTQQLTIVRNIFYHNDYGILCKTGGSARIYANVFIQNAGALLFDEPTRTDSGPGRAAYVDSCIFWNSGPEVDGTSIDNGTGTFVNRQNTQLVVNNSLVGSEFSTLGTGNIDADPILVGADRDVHVDANLPCFSTGFPGFAAGGYLLKGMVPDVHLQPESAARGAGPNGVDMGAMIPSGASISGEPALVTWRTSATLTVGGPDLVAYKYRVNSGPWSAEVVRPEAGLSVNPKPLPPIVLTSLQNGQSYTIYVIGKDSTGLWQSENSPTVSRTWRVDASYRRLVINEVLAVNTSALQHDSAFPDLVELYYDGPTALSLSGMSMSDDPTQPAQFVFGPDATINPGQYLVLYADTAASGADLHLGFGLSADGDAVYLYDRSGVLVDSVVFGQQLADLSIGRVGPLGQWRLTVPTFGQANVAYPLGDSRTVKINEWLAGSDVLFASDFIEIYNPNPDPVDLGGMYLTDNPATQPRKQEIRPLSFVAGRGYGVFWADGTDAPSHVNFHLSVDGEIIGLFDAQVGEIDKIFYGPQTTDFSEGRVPNGLASLAITPVPTPGQANPQAKKTTTGTMALVQEQATKRVLVPTAAISDDWKGGKTFNDSAWLLGTGAPGGVGYEADKGYETLITLDTKVQMYGTGKNNSCYIRIPFTVEAGTLGNISQLLLKMRYDDGFVAYLNGKEVARQNFTGTPAWNSHADSTGAEANTQDFDEYIDISQYKGELKVGANILAIHGMNSSNTSSDFLISAALDAISVQVEGDSGFEEDLRLLDGLRITEIMYHASKGSSYDYIELENTLDEVLDVTGVRFDNGIGFTFPAMTLQPGEYVVVVPDLAAFRSVYGTSPKVVGQYTGNLSNAGEKIVLLLPSPLEAAILRFDYSNTWYPATDGGGKSLTIQDPAAPPATWKDAESWRASDPTPGRP
ncbi:MAG: lamin tail domain-containing protein, partial [Phycisphaerae bacterium]|nr:lamin tail domain-containing protein [Phycisphaerae bacterium]